MNYKTEQAYRAEVRKIIYPSLKQFISNKKPENKLNELLQRLSSNQTHDCFPVVSALYRNCSKNFATVNNSQINLIDESLVYLICSISEVSLKKIILEEIKLMCRIISADNDSKLFSERNEIKGDSASIWDHVRFECVTINKKINEGKLLNQNDLKLLFKIFEPKIVLSNDEQNAAQKKYKCFLDLLNRDSKEKKRCYLIKLVEELEYSEKINSYFDDKKLNINGKNVLMFLFKNGLNESILNYYDIHHCELTATIHLKLLEKNIIKEDYENECDRKQNDLKETLKQEHLRNTRTNIVNASATKRCDSYKTDEVYNSREEAVKAFKTIVEKTGVQDLNEYLVELWLIDFGEINDSDTLIQKRNTFINTGSVNLSGKWYEYKNFENQEHFLNSSFAKNLRKEKDVKYLIDDFTQNKERKALLSEFIEKNKKDFISYGSNLYLYEEGAIEKVAEKLFTKLKLYKNLDSEYCHEIIIDAFKSIKMILHTRYNAKSKSYDGIGHFGGFANELKRLQIKDNDRFVYKTRVEIASYFNNIQNFSELKLKYDGEIKEINSKEELIQYLGGFNDVIYKGARFIAVNNEMTERRKTAIIAANKKFNNLCELDEQNRLKKILEEKYDKDKDKAIVEEYSNENNGAIEKTGTNGLFDAEKYKYDKSTVFSCAIPTADFEYLSSKLENQNENLKEVTTNEALSLFELIQRFGYYSDTGSKIDLIITHDDYKSYAYKYPHEYFAGPIKMITKILDEVEKRYGNEFDKSQEECKRLRLWILGHLFAAAQNDILNGERAKLTKQSFEASNGSRRYFLTSKPAKHTLNLKKFIIKNIGRNREGNLDKEQIEYVQQFFGKSIGAAEFDAIQEIISRVHMSITIKNLSNSVLDCGRLGFAEFEKLDFPEFKKSDLTVYKNIEYESDQGNLSLQALFNDYGDVCSIKKILLSVLSEPPVVSPDRFANSTNSIVRNQEYEKVNEGSLKKKLSQLISNVSFLEAQLKYSVKVECSDSIKVLLEECLQRCNFETESRDDCVTIRMKPESNFDNTQRNVSYVSAREMFNLYFDQCVGNNSEETRTRGFITFFEMILDALDTSIYLHKPTDKYTLRN